MLETWKAVVHICKVGAHVMDMLLKLKRETRDLDDIFGITIKNNMNHCSESHRCLQ